MRSVIIGGLSLLTVGCADVSSVALQGENPPSHKGAGVTYSLPRGLVPVRVFADKDGIGLSVEPAFSVADPHTPPLIAQLTPSPFNREIMNLATDDNGLLSLVSSESQAKLLEVVAELAKTAGRLTFQTGKTEILATSVTVLQNDFDPLSVESLASINNGISAAVRRAASAYAATGQLRGVPEPVVSLSVDPPPQQRSAIDLSNCKIGICVRYLTTRTITVSLNGQPFASKVVNVPSWQVVPISIPQSILSDQKLSVVIKEGVLSQYDLTRDAEALGLVKIPGAIIGGFFGGVTQGLSDKKSVLEGRKEVIVAQKDILQNQKDLEATEKALNDQRKAIFVPKENDPTKMVDANQGGTPAQGTVATDRAAAYRNATLTIYPYSVSLEKAIQEIAKGTYRR